MENRVSGWVCKYLEDKKFGFIASPINRVMESNIFFHISNVEGESITQDDNVSFILISTDRGYKAIDVKIIDDDLDADR